MSTTLSGYRLLKTRDFRDELDKSEENTTTIPSWTCRLLQVVAKTIYLVLIHLLLLLAVALLLRNHRQLVFLKTRILPSELQFAQDAIKYEEVTFDPSGFWEDESQHTPYEGGVSPDIDEAWRLLTSGEVHVFIPQDARNA
ncbi:hypothetical protein DL98DRAFT_580778 [Cadophora sp. DSE1049]|nr:hypothetical protein DL98DRAFT_580778 [Cadophora sp. DSE1049]